MEKRPRLIKPRSTPQNPSPAATTHSRCRGDLPHKGGGGKRLIALAVAALLFLEASPKLFAQAPSWITVKGQVVLPEKTPLPERATLTVTQDKQHCESKGKLPDETLLVNQKNRGIRNVVVWLRPDNANPAAKFDAKEIHPGDAKRKPEEIVIDQPCCLFIPRVALARVGDTILVKNSAPVTHNFMWSSTNNGELNVTIPPKGSYRFEKPLAAESSAVKYSCMIHPWMQGWVRVFDHPYYALTDADGKFEIKNAPAGKFRIVYWHETTGYKGGKEGRLGDKVPAAADNTLELRPTDFPIK
jgi:plastocyanin